MSTQRMRILPVGVLLSVAIMAGWVGQLEWTKRHATTVYLAITGFDPRDLLSGHYLNYRIDFKGASICSNAASSATKKEVCVCIEDGTTQSSPASQFQATACEEDESPRCKVLLRGDCVYGRFTAGFERYYFPENYAKDLFTVPQKASVRAKIGKSGKAIVDAMFVEDKPLLEYLEELTRKKLESPSSR